MEVIHCFSKTGHYIAEFVAIWCFDARFKPTLTCYTNGLGEYDLISIAGGAKVLASPTLESDRDFILGQIQTSINLHHTKEVVLMNHFDCGAYGGSKAFKTRDEEKAVLVADLEKARKYLVDSGITIPIKLLLVDFDTITVL